MVVDIKSKNGFTLIEVILAITVLGVIAIPLLATFTNAFALMAKRQQQIENVSIVRLAKENVVDSIKGGLAKSLKSNDDVNLDFSVDDNDLYYWNNLDNKWVDSLANELVGITNVKLYDSEGNLKEKYYYDVIYNEAETDSNFTNNGYSNLKMFTIDIKKEIDDSLLKSINIVVNTN